MGTLLLPPLTVKLRWEHCWNCPMALVPRMKGGDRHPEQQIVWDVVRGVRLIEATNSIEHKYAAFAGPTDNSDVDDAVKLAPAARVIQ
eukprot:1406595-Amphidinium_carterae.1